MGTSTLVTFLFTDIEGSTRLWQENPEQMKVNQARHDGLLRSSIESNEGTIFKTVGDGFCAAFPEAHLAVNAAVQAQMNLAEQDWGTAPIKVRMGIHTGEAESIGDDYRGYITLSLVSRIMSAGHGGQVLLSDSVQKEIRNELPAHVSLKDMGEHELKGLLSPEHIWQLVVEGLTQEFLQLRTQSTVPNNLPAMLNRFVGRRRELEEIRQRLAETRMLTLMGPGGTGKTRLALQTARDLLTDYEDRVYFIDLASSRDAHSVLSEIARTIGLHGKSDQPLLEDLKNQIQQQTMLLLLDNFEQVTIAASPMAELLNDCPELKMLVTSREPLHLRVEQVFPVPPLVLPAVETRQQSLEKLGECESIQLFIERARAVRPDFELDDANVGSVIDICVRLDGLPLAIELATARLNIFSPKALADRLGDRLKLLKGGSRDLPLRQQTLHDTINWSYDILSADEKRVFESLSVFDGASFESLEELVGRVDQLGSLKLDIFEIIGSLLDKSLLRQTEDPEGESRFRMLETIREFSGARLAENPDFQSAVQRAHAAYFAEFTEKQRADLVGEKRDDAIRKLTVDLDNIRTAWRFWAAEGNLEQLGRFTDCLWLLYDAHGWYHATVQLTTDLIGLLSNMPLGPDRIRQEILLQTTLARALSTTKGFTADVENAYKRALELCDSIGEIPQMFPVLRGLSYFYVYQAQFDKGIQIGKRILALAEHLNDPSLIMEGQMVLGYNLAFDHDLPAGLELMEQSIAGYELSRQKKRSLGQGANPGVVSLTASALCLWIAGFPERSYKRMGEAVAISRKLEHPFSMAYALFHFGLLNLWLNKIDVAHGRAAALMDLAEEHNFLAWNAIGMCLRGVTEVAMGSVDQGLPLIDRGMDILRVENTPPIFWPALLQLQAAAYGMAGRPLEGLSFIDEALGIASAWTGKLAAPDYFCTKGDLLFLADQKNVPEVETWYQLAVDTAVGLKAVMLELRSATRLARLWQGQNKLEQARLVLSSAYSKLTEGFENPDIIEARKLLEEISSK